MLNNRLTKSEGDVETVKNDLTNLFVVESKKLSAKSMVSTLSTTWNENVGKNGYKPIGIVGFDANTTDIVIELFFISENNCIIFAHSQLETIEYCIPTVHILYQKLL